MNPDTGAIAHFETDEDAKSAGFTEKLSELEAAKLGALNRHERRKALADMRRTDRPVRQYKKRKR